MAAHAEPPLPNAEDFVELICDRVKSEALLYFHTDWLFLPIPARLSHPNISRLKQIVSEALRIAQERCPALSAEARDDLYGIDLRPNALGEWADIQKFAFGEGYSSESLSPAAAALLDRVELGELTNFNSELSVRRRVNFFGSQPLAILLAEIKSKRGITIELAESGERYPQRKHLIRFCLGTRCAPAVCPLGLNPILPCLTSNERGLPSPIEFRRWLWELLLQTKPAGNTEIYLWAFSSRREFFRCFPGIRDEGRLPISRIVPLLQSVRGHPDLGISWNFSHDAPYWTVSLKPTADWGATFAKIAAELERPTPEREFGLTTAAAVLYDWLQRTQEFDWGLTPIVEEEIDAQRLLLACPWTRDNFRLWLEILCEEITTKTPLRPRVVSWKKYGTELTRVHLGRRIT